MDLINTELFLLGAPINFQNICLIYPLTIKDITIMGQQTFLYRLNLLTLTEGDIRRLVKKKQMKIEDEKFYNPFYHLIMSAFIDEQFLLELKKAFNTFIQEKVTILEDKIVIGDEKDKRFLTEKNFSDFQNIIRQQNNLEITEAPPPDETERQRYFRLKREEAESIKKEQESKNNENNIDFEQRIISLLCYNVGVDWTNVWNLSYYAFSKIYETAIRKEKYDSDFKAILAGADSKKIKIKYWQNKN